MRFRGLIVADLDSVIGGIGWIISHFGTVGFPGRPDISSLLAALGIGLIGNIYSRLVQQVSKTESSVSLQTRWTKLADGAC